jgi:hypothetical protein
LRLLGNEVGYDRQTLKSKGICKMISRSFETTHNIRKADDIMTCKHQKAKYPVWQMKLELKVHQESINRCT